MSLRNLLLKTALLFMALNLVFAALDPLPFLGRLSLYNVLWPGRIRLPYGDNPDRAYNLSLFNLEAMFASHAVTRPKTPDEYRVLLLGDSSTWGFRLHPAETLAAQINAQNYVAPDGRRIVAYNLGYPIMSLTKDLLILSRLQAYRPDLIVWLVTLESFPYDKQLFPPLLQHNSPSLQSLITNYQLHLDPSDPQFIHESFFDKTLIGQRRALADLLRLQLYGVMWAATGIDQDIPTTFTPRAEDLSADLAFHNLQPPRLTANDLAFDILDAGAQIAGDTPLLLINEPMFVSTGKNSDIRYNAFYPRWAYDDYHALFADHAQARGWHYLDLWRALPDTEYTDSAVHYTPFGAQLLAKKVGEAIVKLAK
jgi:hypothetical protein